MLVLELKMKETATIEAGGKTINVKVIRHKGGKTSLGFEAPKDVQITRASAKVKEPKIKEGNDEAI